MNDPVTYEIEIVRNKRDPLTEHGIRRTISFPRATPDDESESIFLREMQLAWRSLHRAIRRHEVGEP